MPLMYPEAFYSLSTPTLKGLLSDWLTLICSPIQPLNISKFHGNYENFVLVSYEICVNCQDSNFYLISLSILITCLLDNVWISWGKVTY